MFYTLHEIYVPWMNLLKVRFSNILTKWKVIIMKSGPRRGTSRMNSVSEENDKYPSWHITWTWNCSIIKGLQTFIRSFFGCSNSFFFFPWGLISVQPVDNLVHLSNIFCWFLTLIFPWGFSSFPLTFILTT